MNDDTVRRRKVAAATDQKEEAAAAPKPRPWYANSRVGRAVFCLLALFFVMHLFLWKVVVDFVMSEDQELHFDHFGKGWKALKGVVDHL